MGTAEVQDRFRRQDSGRYDEPSDLKCVAELYVAQNDHEGHHDAREAGEELIRGEEKPKAEQMLQFKPPAFRCLMGQGVALRVGLRLSNA